MAGLKVKIQKIPYKKGRVAGFGGITRRQLFGIVLTVVAVGLELYFLWGKISFDFLTIITMATITVTLLLFIVEQQGMSLWSYIYKAMFKPQDIRRFKPTGLYTKPVSDNTNIDTERVNEMKPHIKKSRQLFGKKALVEVSPKENYSTVPFLEIYTMPFEDIDDVAVFQVSEDVYSIVFSFTDIDYVTLDDDARHKTYEAYKKIINSLPLGVTYQEFILNEKIEDLEYEATLIPDVDCLTVEKERMFAKELGNVQRDFIGKANKKSSKKRTLVALSYKLKGGNDNFDQLFEVYKELKKSFTDLNSQIKLLTPEEVLKVMYDFYHPFDTIDFRLPKNYNVLGRDIRHYVAPNTFNFKGKYVEMGNSYTSVLAFALSDNESELTDALISSLVDNSFKICVSKFISREDKVKAMKQLKAEEGALLEKKGKREREDTSRGMTSTMPYAMQQKLTNVENMLVNLADSSNELFQYNLFVSVSAKSKEELDSIVDLLIAKAYSASRARLVQCFYSQEQGLHSMLPLGVNFYSQSGKDSFSLYMLTNALGVVVPFSAKIFFDKGGICYGLDSATNNLIVIDRTKELNRNGFVFGTSGGGKSMFSKMEDVQLYFKNPNDRMMILDPEGEYASILNAIDGEEIVISPSSDTKINIFEVTQAELDEQDKSVKFNIAEKIEFVMSVCETMYKRALSAEQNGLISNIVSELYDKMLSTNDARYCPTFDDFSVALKRYANSNNYAASEASSLSLAIDYYLQDNSMLSGHTTIDFTKKYTILNLKNCGSQWKSVCMCVALNLCERMLLECYRNKQHLWIKADEFQSFFVDYMGNPMNQTATYFKNCFARIRKIGSSIQGITQNVSDLLNSQQARAMLNNVTYVVLLHLEKTELEILSEMFHLSSENVEYLARAKAGQGIIICGKKIVQFDNRISTDSMVYRLLQTTV